MASSLQEIIFRGDQACYQMIDGRFPYIDRAKAAGATGVLIWFWGDALREVAKEFCAYCRERGIGVHLGIGIGAYDVCDGQDPLEPATMRAIERHIQRTLNEFALAGVEFQTGEYDRVEFKGSTVSAKTHASQICDSLNPYVDYLLKLQPSLWVRTELNAEFCPQAQWTEVAESLDPRCTVEWSRFTGPFNGPDCFERGRRLLALDENFSWFLKLHFRRDAHIREQLKEDTPAYQRAWIEHWRGWIGLLDEKRRRTLTICNVDDRYPHDDLPVVSAAAALARDPELATDEVLARYFAAR